MELLEIIRQFRVKGNPVECKIHGEGHINKTYIITTDQDNLYILQWINHNVFRNVEALMSNIAQVTEFLAQKNLDPRAALHLVKTLDDQYYYTDGDGNNWRIYDYVADSFCLQQVESPDDFYQSAVMFGNFQHMLSDFPVENLHETIPDFHNTPVRFQQLHEAIEKDAAKRAANVADVIRFYLDREEKASQLQKMLESGELPLRVTHNDTKLNNILFDNQTRKPLCVLDLDTVMPGLLAFDFGDAIRFGASTGLEDEKDLEKVMLDLNLFRIYSEGFIAACDDMTSKERETLPLAAWTITLENGIRFLADHLNGDVYFGIKRPEHNLDRALTQMKLVQEMEDHMSEMQRIIDQI